MRVFLWKQKLPNQRAYLPWFDPFAGERRAEAPVDFERLVGPAGWARLAPAIRQRFGHRAHVAERFEGRMSAVEASTIGLLLAKLARLIGTPFAPHRGRDVPVTIDLRPEPGGAGVVWDRWYRFHGRAPILVTSTKRLASNGALLECVGGGFGMSLAVFEAGGALHFVSRRYFWRLGRWGVPLPHLLSPGRAHVIHADLGAGRFRFTMTFEHPRLGTLFFQDGIFAEEGDRP